MAYLKTIFIIACLNEIDDEVNEMKLKAKKIAQLSGHNAAIYALSAGNDQQHFYSGAGEGWIVEWDLQSPDLGQLAAKVETQVFSLLHLPDHQLIVAGNMNGGVHWVDLKDSDQTRNIAHHEKGVFGIIRIADAVYTIGGQGMLSKWDIGQRRATESLYLSNQSLRSIVFSESRNEIAVGSSDNNIYLLDASDMSLKYTIQQAHDNSVFSLHYHPTQAILLSGSRDAHLKAWDLMSYQEVVSHPAHWFTINDIKFHPSGKWFATASRDKTIKIWDAEEIKLLKVLETVRDHGHVNSVNRLFWSAHNDYLISASDDRSMIIWHIEED
ncbi:MAG: WD40 repeat domain-containing protein [Saprospiraceae bacterium]|nr:WD40 repeat domain-containing protein [Saprospiraceae bacterium]